MKQREFDARSAFMLWMVGAILLIGACLATGCAGKDGTFEEKQQSLTAGLDALRQAKFKGQIRFNGGGSPLGLNACTNWSLGPQQMTMAVEGEVDFTTDPRAAVAPPAKPTQ